MHTYLKHLSLDAHTNTSFTPLQLASIYNFPENKGDGVKIGIINLDCGYRRTDINAYLQYLGINDTPSITDVAVGSSNLPGRSDADLEATLDLSMIVALVPKANIRMYFAPNTFNGFYQCFAKAISDECRVISCSWGLYEDGYGSFNLTLFNNLFATAVAKNINITCASGDNGSSDGYYGNNVDFPASSPNVIACAGTTLTSSNNARTSEVVWQGKTGGGISKYFAKPSYQNNVSFDLKGKRGVSDIAGVADPATGVKIMYKNRLTTIGGTSATSPLIASLLARIIKVKGSIPFINPIIYNKPEVFYDVTSGNNGAYRASTNWDCCSGMGCPNGQSLLNLFDITSTPTTPTPTTPSPTLNFTFTINKRTVVFTSNTGGCRWQFGDGTSGTTQTILHSYRNKGSYKVSLTVDNVTITKTILISS